jgi:hypothetical protein
MVVTGVSTRSRHAGSPTSPQAARIASGCSRVAYSAAKRWRMMVTLGTSGRHPVWQGI